MMPDYPQPFEFNPLPSQPDQRISEPIYQSEPSTEPPKPIFQTQVAMEEDEFAAAAKKPCLRLFVLFLIILGILIAGWWYFFKRGEEEKPGSEPPQVSISKDSNVVGKEGGTVCDFSSSACVSIPKGALLADVKIEIEKIHSGRVTDLYHLKPDNLRFLKPVKITIPYKEEGLYEGETPYDISLWYGKRSNVLTQKKVTSALLAEKKVSAEAINF